MPWLRGKDPVKFVEACLEEDSLRSAVVEALDVVVFKEASACRARVGKMQYFLGGNNVDDLNNWGVEPAYDELKRRAPITTAALEAFATPPVLKREKRELSELNELKAKRRANGGGRILPRFLRGKAAQGSAAATSPGTSEDEYTSRSESASDSEMCDAESESDGNVDPRVGKLTEKTCKHDAVVCTIGQCKHECCPKPVSDVCSTPVRAEPVRPRFGPGGWKRPGVQIGARRRREAGDLPSPPPVERWQDQAASTTIRAPLSKNAQRKKQRKKLKKIRAYNLVYGRDLTGSCKTKKSPSASSPVKKRRNVRKMPVGERMRKLKLAVITAGGVLAKQADKHMNMQASMNAQMLSSKSTNKQVYITLQKQNMSSSYSFARQMMHKCKAAERRKARAWCAESSQRLRKRHVCSTVDQLRIVLREQDAPTLPSKWKGGNKKWFEFALRHVVRPTTVRKIMKIASTPEALMELTPEVLPRKGNRAIHKKSERSDVMAAVDVIRGLCSEQWGSAYSVGAAIQVSGALRENGFASPKELETSDIAEIFELYAGREYGSLEWLNSAGLNGKAFAALSDKVLQEEYKMDIHQRQQVLAVVEVLRITGQLMEGGIQVTKAGTADGYSYSLVTDNINIQKVNLMHTLLVKDQINATALDDQQPLRDRASDMPASKAIPSSAAMDAIFADMKWEIFNALSSDGGDFKFAAKLGPSLSKNPHWAAFKEKTEFISLGIGRHDENIKKELLEHMIELHKFVPESRIGDEIVFDLILFGGDQLTRAVGSAAQRLAAGNRRFGKRHSGLMTQALDFHAEFATLAGIWKLLWDEKSVADVGTLYHLKTVTGHKAKSDPVADFKACASLMSSISQAAASEAMAQLIRDEPSLLTARLKKLKRSNMLTNTHKHTHTPTSNYNIIYDILLLSFFFFRDRNNIYISKIMHVLPMSTTRPWVMHDR
jgi:hypothetical protein